ncbi:MAG: endonuclease/exonuclease/phosphatase family protein [Bacteroidetes bacterium]|nr:endonuclease/exonuclease/phosphatase family protein [Bacteroidota bacterium]
MKSQWPKYPIASFIFKSISVVAFLGLLLSYFAPFVHPDTFWPIAFFGLLYPVFMLISLSLSLLHLFMRSRWLLVFIVLIAIGGKLHFRQLAWSSEEIEDEDGISLTSYNVRLFDLYNENQETANKNRIKIVQYLESEQTDVLCFQEFYHQDKSKTFSTKDTLIPLLGIMDYQERYSHRSKGRHNFGIITLSKYPMISKGEVALEDNPEAKNDNYCIFSDIVKGSDTFRIYNVHLQSIKLSKSDIINIDANGDLVQERKAAVENVVKKLKRAYHLRASQARKVSEHSLESPYPVIICGDFNDTPLSYTYNQFNKLYFDAFRESGSGIGATYAGKIPAGRIDYIFYSKDLIASRFKLQKEVLSDHRAISCNIYKNPKK